MSQAADKWARERINTYPPTFPHRALLIDLMTAAFDAGQANALIQVNRATLDMETLVFITQFLKEIETDYRNQENTVV